MLAQISNNYEAKKESVIVAQGIFMYSEDDHYKEKISKGAYLIKLGKAIFLIEIPKST